jgi:hypothetical protein
MHDPDRLAAPFHCHHLARQQLVDIDLYRGAGALGALRRQQAGNKRDSRYRRAQPADRGCGEYEFAALVIVTAGIHFRHF